MSIESTSLEGMHGSAVYRDGTDEDSVPSVVTSLLESPSFKNDKSVDAVFYGGALASKELAAEIKRRWPAAGLLVTNG